jgi:hypothetical protein
MKPFSRAREKGVANEVCDGMRGRAVRRDLPLQRLTINAAPEGADPSSVGFADTFSRKGRRKPNWISHGPSRSHLR